MPDLLGVTNAVPGNDANHINRNMPSIPNDPRLQNAPDPTRVTRSDNRTERQDTGDTSGRALRYDSNFLTFLQRMSDTPGLARTMTELLRTFQGTVVSSGMEEGIAVEMSALLEMLKMDEGEFSSFFRSQMQLGNRFAGPLFSILREAYGGTDSEVLRGNILQFLKRYSDYSSSAHVQGNLLRTLTRLTRAIPATYGNQLLGMVSELEGKMAAGDRAGALKLLQGSIMPFLAGYTSRTNDMGLSRSLISLLALDVARYESGSKEGVMQAFRQLGSSATLRGKLGGVSEADLLRLLDTLWALILPAAFSTFPVFIMYMGFTQIDAEILEAARLDGAGELQIFIRIGLPLGKMGIQAAMVLSFLEYWNLVEQPMAFLEEQAAWPLSLYLPQIGIGQAGFAFALAVVVLIPALFVFALGQDALEEGIAYIGVKT